MGWTDDEIDDFFREASSHQKVVYNDDYWKEMEAMLNAEKPAKKRGFWWFFGAMAVALIAVTGYYLATRQQSLLQNNTMRLMHQPDQHPGSGMPEDFQRQKRNADTPGTGIGETQSMSPVPYPEEIVPSRTVADGGTERRAVAANRNTRHSVAGAAYTDTGRSQMINLPQEESLSIVGLPVIRNYEAFAQPYDEKELLRTARTSDPVAQRRIGFYAGVDAGAGTSYIRSSKDLLTQWGVKIGVDYTFFNQVRIGAGIGFRQQIAKNLDVERSRSYYSLGLIHVSQSINYDRLQFIDLNLHTHYVFGKISLGVELTPSYLVSARANLRQVQEINGKAMSDEYQPKLQEEQGFVRTENLNPFGLDAGISFQYEFRRKMILELGMNARMNKMLRSKDFSGEHNKLPVRLELGIIKRF